MHTAAAPWSIHSFFGPEKVDLGAARARLAASHADYQRLKGPSNAIYYPPERKTSAEQVIDDLQGISSLAAVVTRNHYGSVVLNAHHALFIDVDMPDAGDPPQQTASRKPLPSRWQATFDDLCTVLASERGAGFRIYRTAAGFRILATTHEFEPGSDSASGLMASVGADDAFVRLCGIQKTFRARLTPKPWRCGTTQPPNQFPRETLAEQDSFAGWLAQYERACRQRATCRFLGTVGPTTVHRHVAPIVEFHDRETKAFASLELA